MQKSALSKKKKNQNSSLYYLISGELTPCLYGIFSAYALLLGINIFCSSLASEIEQKPNSNCGKQFSEVVSVYHTLFPLKALEHNEEFAGSGILSSRKFHDNEVADHLKFCCALWKLPLEFQLTWN